MLTPSNSGHTKRKKKARALREKEEGSFDRHINVIQQSSFSPDYRSVCVALYLNIAVIFFKYSLLLLFIYSFILFIFFSCWKVGLQPSCCWQIFNWCFWDSFCAFQVWVINYVPLHTDREKYKSWYDYYTYDL